jgi:hypothetical protein
MLRRSRLCFRVSRKWSAGRFSGQRVTDDPPDSSSPLSSPASSPLSSPISSFFSSAHCSSCAINSGSSWKISRPGSKDWNRFSTSIAKSRESGKKIMTRPLEVGMLKSLCRVSERRPTVHRVNSFHPVVIRQREREREREISATDLDRSDRREKARE